MNTAIQRPQLTLEELHQLRWLLGGILTLQAVVTVAYMDVEAWSLMALTGGVSLLSTLFPARLARIPRFVHLLAFPAIAAFFALDLWLRSELLPAMVRLDMLLLLYRALVYRQRRDDLQLILLGLFLVVVAGVLTVSLAFAAQILVYTASALLFLLVLTLAYSGSESPVSLASIASAPPAWAARIRWARLLRRVLAGLDWRIVALAGGLFLGVVVASALLFLVIPRFQLDNGMFLDRFISKKARSGFTDSIKFGDVSEIQQDTTVALHIDVSDPAQIPLSPYWRMLVLDDYSNGTFRMSPALQRAAFESRQRTGSTVYGPRNSHRTPGTWTLYLEPGVSRFLPLLGPFRVLKFAEAQTYRTAPDAGLLALAKDPVTMTAYQVEGFDLSTPVHDGTERFYGERLLSGDAAGAAAQQDLLRRLAREAATGADGRDAAAFSRQVCRWLRDRHAYSLSPRIPDGAGDPLVRWVDSRSPGHCELFAGSFVLLARAAGFPARIVTGFRGGSWNAFAERSFTVRNSDAHAWAEIYDAPAGVWLRADPLEQPASVLADSAAGPALTARRTDRSWAARVDSLRVFWYRRVVSFDQEAQVQTLKELKQLAQSGLDRLRFKVTSGVARFWDWWRSPWNIRRVAQLGAVLVGALALTFLWRWLRRWLLHRSLRRAERRDDPVRREAGRWLRRLTGADLRAENPLLAELQRLRFGRRDTWPVPGPIFRRARALRRARSKPLP